MSKKTEPDGFDRLLADHQHSTHDYEDHDAALRDVLRPWSKLSPESKLSYISSGASLYNVPFERFEQAARQAIGNQPLPAGEHAYLRIHMESQRALWNHELDAFPPEHPLPADNPHRDFMSSLDNVLHVKFERLLDDYLSSNQSFLDADGHMRRWSELSAEGKVEHIARLAAIFDQPLSRFTDAVHDALDGQPLRTDEHACLRLSYDYARQLRGHERLPLPLAQHGHATAASRPDLWLAGSIDPMLTQLEAIGDEFERLARSGEQRQLAAAFKEWIAHTGRTLFIPIARTLADQLFSTAMPQPESPPEHSHERQHKR